MNWEWFSWQVLRPFRYIVLTGLIFSNPSLARIEVANAQDGSSTTTNPYVDADVNLCNPHNSLLTNETLWSNIVTMVGETLTVSNTSEAINGDISSPAALIADPGPDGISLVEAMTAAEATIEYDTIEFDPSLSGAVIAITGGLPVISQGNLSINGDIDDDTNPDITIDGASAASDTGLFLYGASHVIVKGLVVRNFSKHGVSISPDTVGGAATAEDIVLYHNTISSSWNAVQLIIWSQDHGAIRNVEIVSNTLQNSGGGVGIQAGIGDSATDNEISGVSITSNTIINPGYNTAVFVSASSSAGLSRNTVTDIEIRGNQISGHTNTSILIDVANQAGCNDNTVDGVVIADNKIDGTPVTIEIVSVGQSGTNATGNVLSDVTIRDNVLTGGGIQFGGATGNGANDNTISGVLIDRNHISSCAANGVFLIAGSGGAHDNLFENVVLRNTFVGDCTDAGVLLHGETSSSPNNILNGVTIANLTLVDNGIGSSWAGGLNINSKHASNIISSVTVSNTILWGNGGGDAIRGSLVPDSVAYSLLSDGRFVGSNGNIYQSPEFADPGSGDYRLQSDSPCVDTGDPSAADVGPEDLDNRLRVWDGDDDSVTVVDRGAWEYNSIAGQEMDVQGNGVSIIDGDVVPATWDATDFGTAAVSGGTVEQTYTIKNTGSISLTLTGMPKVEITGTHAADFSVTAQPVSPIIGGGSVTFTIEFYPGATGLREATLSIANDDSDENPYDFSIQGTGTAPEMDVQGNDISILDGDTVPSTTDGTDFGDAAAAGETVEHTFTIENAGGADLNLTGSPRVEITGTHAADFSVTTQPDFPVASGESVTFTVEFDPSAAGLREATLSIANDDSDENPYTFAIQGTGTAPPTVGFGDAPYSDWEDIGTAMVTVTLSVESDKTVTVTYGTSDGTATVADGDYNSVSEQLVFAPGETTKTFGVDITDDGKDESAEETINLQLSDAVNASGTPTSTTLTIYDDDNPPTVDFSNAAYTVNEDADSAPITVTLGAASGLTVTVEYSTTNGTATAGEDYTAISGTLTFTPGITSQSFTVAVADDEIEEGEETVTLTLFNAENATIGGNSPAVLTITEKFKVYLPLALRQFP